MSRYLKTTFPSISLYALRSIPRDESENFPIIDYGYDTEYLIKLPAILRVPAGTILISYSTAPSSPPYWWHQLH